MTMETVAKQLFEINVTIKFLNFEIHLPISSVDDILTWMTKETKGYSILL